MLKIKTWYLKDRLTRDLRLLLAIGGIYSLSVALSNTFVNVYLWKKTGNFFHLGFYNFLLAMIQFITFIIAGKVAKRVDRIVVLRIGLVFLAVFFVTVLLSGNSAGNYLFFLGGLLGAGYGFYWLAYNVLTFEITEPDNRDFFNGFLGVLSSAGGMVGPIVAGLIISQFEQFTGYMIIFSISLGLFAVASLLSFFMKRRSAEGRYFFLTVLKERKRNRNWKMITNATISQGLREGIFAFIINVYVYIVTGSEMALGTFAFVHSFVSFITYYVSGRFIRKRYRKSAILFGGMVLFLSIFIIIFQVNYTLLLLYSGVIAFAYPIVLVPFLSTSYDVIGKSRHAAEMRVEYVVVREVFLNIGRMVSIFSFLIGISLFPVKIVIPILLVVFGSGYLLIYVFIRNVHLDESPPF
ncbi:MFS transporter [Fervidibacillus halotolerans]|uniref:MFS transporter n=1 Tax=Fervidibacillus halotolerans TaxID=2980027 RepID=A0A9E8LXH1_9BACI|nr:MFS transporter [Fervidibacillus halotolerans]WAA11470.1 MFS transporter [Fervidibacillus halotolerans]